jgi:hypothetical protein
MAKIRIILPPPFGNLGIGIWRLFGIWKLEFVISVPMLKELFEHQYE